MKGQLWPGHIVELAPDTPEWGGAWLYPARGGQAIAYDQALLEFTYEQLVRIQCTRMIDIGASTGSFSLLPAFVLGLECMSFEPQPGPFGVLQQNVALNKLTECVSVHQVALSDAVGYIGLWLHPEQHQSGLSTCQPQNWPHVMVPTSTIDTLCPPPTEFVKIDVEGWELRVLEGGRQYLGDIRPALLIEYKHTGMKVVTDFLTDLGYRWLDLENTRDLYAWRKPEHAP